MSSSPSCALYVLIFYLSVAFGLWIIFLALFLQESSIDKSYITDTQCRVYNVSLEVRDDLAPNGTNFSRVSWCYASSPSNVAVSRCTVFLDWTTALGAAEAAFTALVAPNATTTSVVVTCMYALKRPADTLTTGIVSLPSQRATSYGALLVCASSLLVFPAPLGILYIIIQCDQKRRRKVLEEQSRLDKIRHQSEGGTQFFNNTTTTTYMTPPSPSPPPSPSLPYYTVNGGSESGSGSG
jgi:hypothetical protein